MREETNRRSLRTLGARKLLPVCLMAGLCFGTLPVRAAGAQDDSNGADVAAARSLALEGMKLADAGRCVEAVDKLSRAEKLHHAPIVLARLGECQVTQGKIVDGTENLRRVLREALPANPSAALTRARERAETVLDSAKPKIAGLTISVSGQQGAPITVTVDGTAVPTALLGAERPTDPGEHIIEASATGFLKSSARVGLGPGEKQAVTLKLETDPNFVAPAAPTAAAPEAPSAPRSTPAPETNFSASSSSTPMSAAPNRTPAYIVGGVGVAALLAGAGFGLVAMKDKSDLDKDCKNNVCSPAVRDKLDSGTQAGTISTILFAAGGGGIALGTILFFAAGGRSTETGSQAHHGAAQTHFQPRAWVGPGTVGFGGDF
jgi:hypothetical protein